MLSYLQSMILILFGKLKNIKSTKHKKKKKIKSIIVIVNHLDINSNYDYV